MSLAELHKLSCDEKLRIIEALWADLTADQDDLQSPAWHEEELRKTEADFAAGRVAALDWQKTKEELRRQPE